MASSKKSIIRNSAAQIRLLIEHMASHPNFAAEEYQGPLGSAQYKQQWLALKAQFDEIGPARSVQQWKHFTAKCEDLTSGTGDRLSLDIGALKQQYARLRERQKQAHVILAAACARHAAVGVPSSPTSLTVNNLLLGKSAIVSNRGRRLGPPPGAIPPSRQTLQPDKIESQLRRQPNDTISWKEEKSRKLLNRRDNIKWQGIKKEQLKKCRKVSIDLEETGEGVIVSELEANQMIASMRSRSSSETSSYSSRSASSTDTSLCDDKDRGSDSEAELPEDNKENHKHRKDNLLTVPSLKESKIIRTPIKKESVTLCSIACPKMVSDISVTKVSEYLDSAAGEPLRTYIGEFESKLKDSLDATNPDISYKSTSSFIEMKFNDCFSVSTKSESYSYVPLSSCKALSPYKQYVSESAESHVVQSLSKMAHDEDSKSRDIIIKPLNFSNTKTFTNLSPINLISCNYNLGKKSPYDYVFTSSFPCLSPAKPDTVTRPPDVIDSLTIYPNCMPDIDLSDKNISDIDSPPRSPGVERIIVSEDEPPIQLKIDKYFEHSPEFFGARIINAYTLPRRSTDRKSRLPKKPDSLNLQSSHNKTLLKNQPERALSLPHSHSFTDKIDPVFDTETTTKRNTKNETTKTKESPLVKQATSDELKHYSESISIFKEYVVHSGRKNSEKALEIIQENSKILSRILTKQNINDMLPAKETSLDSKISEVLCESKSKTIRGSSPGKIANTKLIDSPLIKESTSDSLIGYGKKITNDNFSEKTYFVRVRPISIDDPFSLDICNIELQEEEFTFKAIKTSSIECLVNKTDVYGWENKGFQAKYDFKANILSKPESNFEFEYKRKINELSTHGEESNLDVKPGTVSDWTQHSFSAEYKTSETLHSSEAKDTSSYDHKYTTGDYNYALSTKYNDYLLSKASDIRSITVEQGPKLCENLLKSESSQVSDFAHVTSSISLSYGPSAEDDSPIEAKSNSSDTFCQITSLDQVSTPISPKIFPKETPSLSKEYAEQNKNESDDTCTTITSLIETDTLSSISYPCSLSTESYHPFPTCPLRMPKELSVRLGAYPKDVINSSPE